LQALLDEYDETTSLTRALELRKEHLQDEKDRLEKVALLKSRKMSQRERKMLPTLEKTTPLLPMGFLDSLFWRKYVAGVVEEDPSSLDPVKRGLKVLRIRHGDVLIMKLQRVRRLPVDRRG
jgi:mannitol-1-phosphate/altronate dehydrogenase